MYKGKPILKAWIHGNSLKLYYNLIPGSPSNTKYGITDVSYAKIHETTPTLLKVSGPRLLEYAKELVDMYMKDKETKMKHRVLIIQLNTYQEIL